MNRLCGSGLQAIVSASQAILLGDTDVAIAGGAEVMSRALYGVPAMRWGARMNNAQIVDMMVGAAVRCSHAIGRPCVSSPASRCSAATVW